MPVSGAVVSDPFGAGRGHRGIDLAVPAGTEICAATDGEVIFSGQGRGYGNYILLQHENGWQTLYAHCSALLAEAGDHVAAGACIALVGATGDATGPHLHFELRRSGAALDPAPFLQSPTELAVSAMYLIMGALPPSPCQRAVPSGLHF